MNWPAECVVVIPCLNEGKAIAGLVGEIRQFLPRVLVVDDGSSDETANLARSAGADVIRRESPSGKGAALRIGWDAARERGASWVMSMDGDGQHAPGDIPTFLSAAGLGNIDLVVGNRMNDSAAMPWLRRGVNRWMSARLSKAAGMTLPDSQCGFRLMTVSAWSALTINARHFEIESEILLQFIRGGFQVKFVPVQTIYNGGRSKIHPVSDTARWLRWWARVGR